MCRCVATGNGNECQLCGLLIRHLFYHLNHYVDYRTGIRLGKVQRGHLLQKIRLRREAALTLWNHFIIFIFIHSKPEKGICQRDNWNYYIQETEWYKCHWCYSKHSAYV